MNMDSPAPLSKELPNSLRDPSKLFSQSEKTRRWILASYWMVIILALPLWWFTTSIERLSLPSILALDLAQKNLSFPVTICLHDQKVISVPHLQHLINDHALLEPRRWNGLDAHVLGEGRCDGNESTYHVASQEGDTIIRDRQLLLGEQASTDVATALASLLLPYSPSHDNRVAQYSTRLRLAFSLLNEDASLGNPITGWNIESAINSHIKPILNRLSVLHNFTIESQVQLHAPLAFKPQEGINSSYWLTPEDLTVFINSAEWTLSSSASNDPVLHFILFIPSLGRRPLSILNNDGSPSDSDMFLLPQWGGIIIHNPPSQDQSVDQLLPTLALHKAFSGFASQLLELLGVPQLPPAVDVSSRSGNFGHSITDWQLDALLRRRALENAKNAQDTLQSIVRLVGQIENMPVGDDVRDDVEEALRALNEMYASSPTSLLETFRYSAHAFTLASAAFFNPGMLALLYFPAEHKYAIYTPLFASAVIPLFVAAFREFLAWRRQR